MLKFLHNAIAFQCKMFEIILNVELLEKCIKEKKQIENNDDSILWFIELELETDVSVFYLLNKIVTKNNLNIILYYYRYQLVGPFISFVLLP